MWVVCSYCLTNTSAKQSSEDGRGAHWMCPDCRAYFDRQEDGLSQNDYLEQFDLPVVVCRVDGHVLGLNRAMREWFGNPLREGFDGQLGEVAECIYARRPEGCGNTIHCETCAIRQAIRRAAAGEPTLKEKAYLHRAADRLELSVSAVLLDIGVVVTITPPNDVVDRRRRP